MPSQVNRDGGLQPAVMAGGGPVAGGAGGGGGSTSCDKHMISCSRGSQVSCCSGNDVEGQRYNTTSARVGIHGSCDRMKPRPTTPGFAPPSAAKETYRDQSPPLSTLSLPRASTAPSAIQTHHLAAAKSVPGY